MYFSETQKPFSNGQGYNNPASNQVNNYTTPRSMVICILVIVFIAIGIIACGIMIAVGLVTDSNLIFSCSFIFLIFPLIGILIGCCATLYSSITVDQIHQTVSIQIKKLFLCCSKTSVIKIEEISKVITQIDPSVNYEVNGEAFNAFEIIFELKDGNSVIGCSGVIDKDGEFQKAMDFLRTSLPQEMDYEGDLISS